MMKGAKLTVRGVSKRYGKVAGVDGIDLEIRSGSYVVILGPSGSGKTTLLSILGGFTRPDAGRVLIDDADVTDLSPARRATTTVFQDYALFPHMDVAQNVGFGLTVQGIRGGTRVERVAAMLALVGLPGFGGRRVSSLSGGQQQRVALARALVVEPRVLLLDEPLGALDLGLRKKMQDELGRIQDSLGVTFVHVTHNQEEAMSLADEVVVLRDGHVEDVGSPQRLYLRPATRFVATFMGDSNLIGGYVSAAREGTIDVRTELGTYTVAGDGALGMEVTLAIRPEHLKLDGSGGVRLGTGPLVNCQFLGIHQRCRVRLGQQELSIVVPAKISMQEGATVVVSLNPNDFAVVN